MPSDAALPEYDEQDQAEVFDEDNYSLDGAGDLDSSASEDIPDVYDVTTRLGDADTDDALAASDADELEEEALDDVELDDDDEDLEDDDDEDLEDDDDDLDDVDELDDDEVDLEYTDDVEDAADDEVAADSETEEELSGEDVAELGYAEEEEQDETQLDFGEDKDAVVARRPAEGTSAEAGHLTSKTVDETDLDDLHHEARQDVLLDEGVEETFPASDPVSVKRIT